MLDDGQRDAFGGFGREPMARGTTCIEPGRAHAMGRGS
jgi:hypothetical protein